MHRGRSAPDARAAQCRASHPPAALGRRIALTFTGAILAGRCRAGSFSAPRGQPPGELPTAPADRAAGCSHTLADSCRCRQQPRGPPDRPARAATLSDRRNKPAARDTVQRRPFSAAAAGGTARGPAAGAATRVSGPPWLLPAQPHVTGQSAGLPVCCRPRPHVTGQSAGLPGCCRRSHT